MSGLTSRIVAAMAAHPPPTVGTDLNVLIHDRQP
jgi:hypothetical protein